MKRKHKRLTFVGLALLLIAAAAGLILSAFEESIVFFHSPTDIVEKSVPATQRLRLGGLVEEGSVEKLPDAVVMFKVTDMANSVQVSYRGILPDLFREGQGVVAEGTFSAGVFTADEVLAKHDENYMPPEVADALKKSGKWDDMSEEMKRQGHVPGETTK
ncbi:MAG: cytochrome c maturation protein CcmE [Rhodospirillaceae bacterium]|nr:cytochrome c maturation protein CcmE [Rhodospirillaceae bacterium]MBT5243711.1 cytochrome c maturation protein CcmE [Rhodospirillaceae bacterium]MBT5563808.1 cytochrome c maturation protein CcmE [Rhodospirillaceae bacterium]MBT6241703.1 cytochrome c maturation protein CcmE [Rhodospirillaceae bacterium]MBT7138193.1 cytochrome c maturation protein CcmE [Rhodospirillaceae bacterium]